MKYYKRFVRVFISIIILLFLLEITARFYYFGWDNFSFAKMNSFRNMGVSGMIRRSSNPDIRYELKPNIDAWFMMARFKTNSDGLRDKHYEIQKPDGVFRVAVMGSSYTSAIWVPVEHAFHSIMEDELNKQSGTYKYEFINFGVAAYNSWQILGLLKEKGLSYKPDLILFCGTKHTFYNEILRAKRYRKPFKEKPAQQGFRKSYMVVLAKRVIYNFRWMWAELFYSGRTKKDQEDLQAILAEKDNERGLNDLYVQILSLQKQTGIPVIIVILGTDPHYLPVARKIEDMAVPFGLPVVNTVTIFKNKRRDAFCVHRLDCHPNSVAHRMIAGQLLSSLLKMGYPGEKKSS